MISAGQTGFYDGSIVQTAVLKWALRNKAFACAVPGFTNFGQLEEDIGPRLVAMVRNIEAALGIH